VALRIQEIRLLEKGEFRGCVPVTRSGCKSGKLLNKKTRLPLIMGGYWLNPYLTGRTGRESAKRVGGAKWLRKSAYGLNSRSGCLFMVLI